MRQRVANPHDAETCRLLALCALELEERDIAQAEVWQVRALARFALLQWTEGVAAVFMGRAFSVLARDNSDYPKGVFLDAINGSLNALSVIDELEPFAKAPGSGVSVGTRSPSPALIERFLYEKRGFLLMLLKRFDEARESYKQAAEVAVGNARGELKVRAGAALVDYLDAVNTDNDATKATGETIKVLELAREAGETDIERTAAHNVEVMLAAAKNLLAYEIL